MIFAGALATALTACEGGGGGAATDSQSTVSAGCHSEDPSQICLGLKYVSYEDSAGAVASQSTALKNLEEINSIWRGCGIQFQIEEYQAVDPAVYGLAAGSGAMGQLDQIRNTFNDGRTMLVVQTGYWGTTKNAWAQLPGGTAYGVVLESTVATSGNIVGHELGHYMNLDHDSDPSNLMSAIVYPSSLEVTPGQCEETRSTANSFWAAMKR